MRKKAAAHTPDSPSSSSFSATFLPSSSSLVRRRTSYLTNLRNTANTGENKTPQVPSRPADRKDVASLLEDEPVKLRSFLSHGEGSGVRTSHSTPTVSPFPGAFTAACMESARYGAPVDAALEMYPLPDLPTPIPMSSFHLSASAFSSASTSTVAAAGASVSPMAPLSFSPTPYPPSAYAYNPYLSGGGGRQESGYGFGQEQPHPHLHRPYTQNSPSPVASHLSVLPSAPPKAHVVSTERGLSSRVRKERILQPSGFPKVVNDSVSKV